MSDELKPCPFCGETPEIPECHGTCYEFDCDCGMSGSSIQISDLMTIEERLACPNLCRENDFKYPDKYIKRAEKEAITAWNHRADQTAEMQAAIVELRDMLGEARNGLEWYRDEYPQDTSEADNQMLEQIDQAITKTAKWSV